MGLKVLGLGLRPYAEHMMILKRQPVPSSFGVLGFGSWVLGSEFKKRQLSQKETAVWLQKETVPSLSVSASSF